MKTSVFIALISVCLGLIFAQATIFKMRNSINSQRKLIEAQSQAIGTQSKLIETQARALAAGDKEIFCVTNRQWKVTEGDLNVLFEKLWERGFSNTILRLEKNGHLFEVDLPNRTNATINYVGKYLNR